VAREDSPAHTSDGGLASRVLASAPGAARAEEAELCRRFAPRLRLYGLRHLRDEQAAADLVQHVLLVTIEKLRSRGVREPERIASFVLGVARMTAHEMRRGGKREVPLSSGELQLADVSQHASEPLAGEHLARCLAELRERERSVLVFTYYQERNATQIAAVLGLKEGNVRVIRHRAIEQLRRCMGLAGGEAS
jgi:RNA polymerase sigma-70 factor (ECF subfamily)